MLNLMPQPTGAVSPKPQVEPPQLYSMIASSDGKPDSTFPENALDSGFPPLADAEKPS
jgi:hypothetical protein